MKINLRLLRIYLAKIYPWYNLASIIKFLVHRQLIKTCNLGLLSESPTMSWEHVIIVRSATLEPGSPKAWIPQHIATIGRR